MNKISKSILIVFFLVIANKGFARSTGDLKQTTPQVNDSTTAVTSNIMIFKMIVSPAPVAPTNYGSLKKAGKVARTSTSRN
jgi:hypothetical protein